MFTVGKTAEDKHQHTEQPENHHDSCIPVSSIVRLIAVRNLDSKVGMVTYSCGEQNIRVPCPSMSQQLLREVQTAYTRLLTAYEE